MTRSATLTRSRTSKTGKSTSRKPNGAIRTYRNAVAFLESQINYEKHWPHRGAAQAFKLSRMARLLAALGNPHKRFRSVHIAGTKGKGSTAAMLSAMLRANKLTVGVYTSPHLMDLRERITVNDRMISEPDLTRLVVKIAPIVRRQKNDPPTFFEILTAIAFVYFANRKVDLAVVETGLGGRLDATNLLKPDVCAITSISFDHVRQLGNSLAAIAEEKAGIFKPSVPVVCAPQHPEVKRTLKRVAQRVGCPLLFAGEDIEYSSRFESSRGLGPHTRICVTTASSHYEHLHVPLLGEHQAVNCAVALGLLDQLKARGFRIDDESAINGLARVSLPGRMEIIFNQPRVLADAAHNAASIEALMRAIGQNIAFDSLVVIFGCNADKDIDGMLRLLPLGADKVIFTRSANPRAADPQELLTRFKELTGRVEQTAPSLEDAFEIANKAVTREDLICVTGSFYLVADAKRLLARRPAGSLVPVESN